MNIPTLEQAVPDWGNGVSRFIGRTGLKLWGWKIQGNFPNLSKFVIIGAPHTSNWDFLLAMLFIFGVGIRVYWMGKHTFVNGPFHRILRWLGGVAVDRTAPQGYVAQAVAAFRQRDKFILGIAPEGTRKKVHRWRTGFYHIACGADVPIVPITIDYGRKLISILSPYLPTGNATVDITQLQTLFVNVRGKYPHQF